MDNGDEEMLLIMQEEAEMRKGCIGCSVILLAFAVFILVVLSIGK